MKYKYKQSGMVNWFEPAILLQTGLKSVISGLFGNYADRREMEAALDVPAPGSVISREIAEYTAMEEIWIDFISDTGDGFNPTYSIALTAAQPSLKVKVKGEERVLPRAKVLVLGGDQIYPTPTGDIYENKFKVPFEAALPEVEGDENYPHMYAIPGNHDWYDGLGSFMKVFCQQRWIGNWKTMQTRSYFALKLPHNYWIWATDIQLNEDIDKPQLNYFTDVARNKMQAGDRVILCTAEPAWIYKQLYAKDKSYDRLRYFIDTYITEDKAECIGKKFELATVLTGDLHHYSHYCFKDEKGEANHYIGAGGGGGFLHLTHNLPPKLEKLKEKGITLQKAFPDKQKSLRLLFGNLIFPVKNYYFSILLGFLHLLFYWLLLSRFSFNDKGNYLEHLDSISFGKYLCETGLILLSNPVLSLFSVLLIYGFTKFTDIKTGIRGIWLIGLIHGLLQCMLIYSLIWLIGTSTYQSMHLYNWQFIFLLELLIAGSFIGGLLMGLYLLLSNLLFGIHIDESSSSLASENYKNFLRMSINDKGLTIYPIGIRKVTTRWNQTENGKDIRFNGDLPEYEMIENPIFIKK
ncbi:metallophosphoesterase [Flavihumibacter sp. R14]|nr:metallophosphoesterase [Flavihumibacter soli]